jgi:YggT family protein
VKKWNLFAKCMMTAIGSMQLLLGIRFVLKIFDIPPASPIISFIYFLSDILLFPFSSVFEPVDMNGLYMIELHTIVGLIFYTLLGIAILRFIAKRNDYLEKKKYVKK